MRSKYKVFFSGSVRRMCTLALVALSVFACRSTPVQEPSRVPPQAQPSVAATPSVDPAFETWLQGIQLFEAGEYEKALPVFQSVHENAVDEALKYRVLFDLCSVRLVLAQTPEDYGQALAQWNEWEEMAPPSGASVDPRMLTPFLNKLNPAQYAPPPQKPVNNQAPSARKVQSNAYTNYLLCKEALRQREREMERMRTDLGERKKEIRNLRKQINSLEEIHLKFQGLKQETSTQ